MSTLKTYFIHSLLFILTLIATTFAGAEWMTGKLFFFMPEPYALQLSDFWQGLHYSIPFLLILTFHEFGHYFVARYYDLKVTLPFYIPLWLGFLGMPTSIGTMGAFIQIRSQINSRKEFFDVGIAGPLAGFVVALVVLFYGFTHLPAPEHIFVIHPEYQKYGLDYAKYVYENAQGNLVLGNNLLFEFFKNYVASDPNLVPNPNELMHYPYLMAGYLALFFTALNLIPIGQLDGGHILYGLIGKKHKYVSFTLFTAMVFYAGLGIFTPFDDTDYLLIYAPIYVFFLYFAFLKPLGDKQDALLMAAGVLCVQFVFSYFFPKVQGYQGWLVFSFVIGRFLGVYHPTTQQEEELSLGRKILGWLTLLIFILCFSPQPFRILI